jgi:Uma2 family endonuclease
MTGTIERSVPGTPETRGIRPPRPERPPISSMTDVVAPSETKKSQSPFGPRDAGQPMDLDEFEAAEFEPGYRYELIHGVLVVTPPPLEEERDANEELGHWLRAYKDSHPQGGSLDLSLPEQNVRTSGQNRRCDRAIWAGLARRPRTRGPVRERDAPTIIVEFPSSRPADQRRDYMEKGSEYRDLGIKEYWIIDRFSRTMTVHRRHGASWTKSVLGETGTYTTQLLPGFELPLRRLLAVSDEPGLLG